MSLEKQLGINIRGRNTFNLVGNNKLHSPDGHFDPSDDFARNWHLRSFSLADIYVRRRSKDQINCMQDVEEEEAVTNDGIHQWRPPKRTDSRSPCPALNTAANHNYLPRHGRNLTIKTTARGLKECYNISWALALLLTVGGFIILRFRGVGRGWINPTIDLEDLAAHDVLEHNASLTRLDVDEIDPTSPSCRTHHPPGALPTRSRSVSSSSSTAVASAPSARTSSLLSYFFSFFSFLYPSAIVSILMSIASRLLSYVFRSSSLSAFESLSSASSLFHKYPQAHIKPNRSLIRALLADSASGTHFTIKDIARARIRRLDNCPNPKVSRILNQFADAELCLSLAILSPGKELKVELEALREWLEEERLPRNWKRGREIGFWENHQNTAKMQGIIRAMRQYKAKDKFVKTVVFE